MTDDLQEQEHDDLDREVGALAPSDPMISDGWSSSAAEDDMPDYGDEPDTDVPPAPDLDGNDEDTDLDEDALARDLED